MSLKQWLANGWLTKHTTSPQELADLFAVVARDLTDAKAAHVSDDWRFGIAYNAALQLATAALYASGFKPARGQSHHLRAIQSLEFTIELEKPLLDQVDAFRAKRHTSIYDAAGAVSSTEAQEMIALAEALEQRVEAWLASQHPELLE